MVDGPQAIRVLLVEESDAAARPLEICLSEPGDPPFETTRSTSLSEALTHLQREGADVVLVDLALSDSSGLDTLKLIEKGAPHVPVVVLTTLEDDRLAAAALEHGAQDLLLKGEISGPLIRRTLRYAIDRHRSRTSLIESERRYRRLIDTSPDLIFVHSDGVIRFVNETACRRLGAGDPSQIVDRPLMDILHPEYAPLVLERVRYVMDKGEVAPPLRQKLRALDGSEIDVEVTAIPFRFEGKPAVQAIARDISGMTEAEERFARIFQLNPLPTLITDAQSGAIIQVNGQFSRSFGFEAWHVVGRTTLDIGLWVRPSDRSDLVRTLEREGSIRNAEIHLRCRNGKQREVYCSADVIMLSGRPVYIVMLVDISELKENQRLLTENRAFLEKAQEIGHIGSWTASADIEGQVVWSKECYQIFGLDPESFSRKILDFFDRVHPEDRPLVERARVAGLAGGGFEVEHRIIRSDGAVRWVHEAAELIRDAEGRPLKLVGVIQDVTDRRHAEAELRRLADIVQYSDDAIFVENLDGVIESWNKGAERLYGYTASEIIGRSITELIPPDRLDQAPLVLDRIKAGEPIRHMETVRLRKDGSVVDVSITISPIIDARGVTTGASIIARDISEPKRRERALYDSEQRFRQMAENIREVFWMTDLTKNEMIYISPGYEEIWGRTCESLYAAPENWLDAIHADDRARVIAALEKQTSGQFNEEYRIVRPDGSVRRIWDRAFPVQDAEGRVYRIVGIAEDVTEARVALDRLREEELRMGMILEQIAAAVWSLDRNLVITSWTGHGLSHVGLSPTEQVGRTLSDYVQSDDGEHPAIAAARRALNGEALSADWELHGTAFQSRFQPLRDGAGAITGVAAVTINVSDRRKLEDRLRQAQKMEAIGQLAGGVAHDFNNILNVIMGYADMLSHSVPKDAEWSEDIEEIRKATRRAASLTHQLLAFSRRQALQPRLFDLNGEIGDLTKMLNRLMGENIQWRTNLDPELWMVWADQGQIQQVIINLAVNARDAMPAGGVFSLRTRNTTVTPAEATALLPAGEYVTLTVSDTGVGMNEETRSRAFEPFFTTKEKGKGTGLGLSMVYGVIKQSNGYISVDSAPGRGTTFTLSLPKADVPSAAGRTAGETADTPNGCESILVIEDEEPVRRLISRILEKCGFKVLLASNGRDALDLASRFEGDLSLVLTDIVLPDIRGDEVVKQVVAKHPGLKAIFMSGYLDVDLGRFTIDEKTPFLQKPFSPETLTQKLRSVLDTTSLS